MQGNCHHPVDCCPAYERLRGYEKERDCFGDFASRCLNAMGQPCVFCNEKITSLMSGHDCNVYGNHHEDCEPY